MEPVCYIIGAAPTTALPSPREGDFLIAADKGYAALQEACIAPDLILGDFDSLGYTPEGENVLSHSPIKDDTDLLLAIRWAMERGWRRFVIYGALGGARLDQTVASFQTLRFLAAHGARGTLVGDGWNVMYVEKNTGRIWQIGALSKGENWYVNRACQGVSRVDGLFVSDVYTWRYEDTLRADATKNTTYASQWTQEAIQYGSVLIVDIAGYTGNQ